MEMNRICWASRTEKLITSFKLMANTFLSEISFSPATTSIFEKAKHQSRFDKDYDAKIEDFSSLASSRAAGSHGWAVSIADQLTFTEKTRYWPK